MHTILKMMMTMQLNPTHLTLSTRVAASTHCIKNTNFVQLITGKTYINLQGRAKVLGHLDFEAFIGLICTFLLIIHILQVNTFIWHIASQN